MSDLLISDDLKNKIADLENRQHHAWIGIKEQSTRLADSYKPANLFAQSIHSVIGSSRSSNILFSTAMGLIAGYFSVKISDQKEEVAESLKSFGLRLVEILFRNRSGDRT